MYSLTHYAYCGMSIKIAEGDHSDVRSAAAKLISRRRKDYPVYTLDKGNRWEICEPEDCMMVPDNCGILKIEFESDHEYDDNFFDEDAE